MRLRQVAPNPSEGRLLAANDKYIVVQVASGVFVRRLALNTGLGFCQLVTKPDQKFVTASLSCLNLVTGVSENGEVYVWEINPDITFNGSIVPQRRAQCYDCVPVIAMHMRNLLVVVTRDGIAHVVNEEDGKSTHQVDLFDPIVRLIQSGKDVLTVSKSGHARLISISQNE